MERDDNVFFVRKRSAKVSVKKKRRESTLTTPGPSEASDSDGNRDESRRSNAARSNKRKPIARRKPMKRKGLGASEPWPSKVSERGLELDHKPDYSSSGLELLRKKQLSNNVNVSHRSEEILKPTTTKQVRLDLHDQSSPDVPPEERDVKASKESTTVDRGNSGRFAKTIENLEFISLDRDATEDKLGNSVIFNVEADIDPILVDAFGSDDDADEWEREQLRRAGHGAKVDVGEVHHSEISRIDEIMDEEEMGFGSRGELGVSVLDSCLLSINKASEYASDRKSLYAEGTDRVCKSIETSRSNFPELERNIEDEKHRQAFYKSFLGFVSDLCEMLDRVLPRINDSKDNRMASLSKKAKAYEDLLTATTDEFGRVRDASDVLVKLHLEFLGNGAHLEADYQYSISSQSENEDNVFSEEELGFARIRGISKRFLKWQDEFPSDYANAFATKCLGNICGMIASGKKDFELLLWISDVPKPSRWAAVEASKALELLSARMSAEWNPMSTESTKTLYRPSAALLTVVCEHRTAEHQVEQVADKLFSSFVGRLSLYSTAIVRAFSNENSSQHLLRDFLLAVTENSLLFYSKVFTDISCLSHSKRMFSDHILEIVEKCISDSGEEKQTEVYRQWILEIANAVYRVCRACERESHSVWRLFEKVYGKPVLELVKKY